MSNKKTVVVNASNLHVGGGVQVATSFIDELSRKDTGGLSIDVLVSTVVYKNLLSINSQALQVLRIKTLNTFGPRAILSRALRDLCARAAVVFTVFGPHYSLSNGAASVVSGFAVPDLIYPDSDWFLSLNRWGRNRQRQKRRIQTAFFRRSDVLVVELAHVKRRLCELGVKDESAIHVVKNALSAVYFDRRRWRAKSVGRAANAYAVGFVGRDYAHKNIEILPSVKKILSQSFGLEVDFYVTLTDSEWSRRSCLFREAIRNVGALTVAECPSFYEAMDAVIFPSLLECFSVTPLEAMYMRKPLFASDRDYVKEVCLKYASYFDPNSAMSIAKCIAGYISNEMGRDSSRLEEAAQHAANFSSSESRTDAYLEIIRETARR